MIFAMTGALSAGSPCREVSPELYSHCAQSTSRRFIDPSGKSNQPSFWKIIQDNGVMTPEPGKQF